jgi:hypothetical protein
MICDNGYCGHQPGQCPAMRPDGSSVSDATSRPRDAASDGARDVSDGVVQRPDATAADVASSDGTASDAAASDAMTPDAAGPDARRDATGDGAPDATTDGGGPLACPPRHSFNVVRHICVLDHDLNGDGKADLMAVNVDGITALISTGTSFEFRDWLDNQFVGTGGAYAADVTGQGYSDAVAFDESAVYVIGSGITGFGSIAANFSAWLPMSFRGDIATSVMDVNGDGRADAVVFNDDEILVALSTGTRFEDPVQWLAADLTGYIELWMADVDGDGMVDVIYLGADSVEVSLSTGTSFAPPVVWDDSPLSSDITAYFADVDGDGRADGLQIDSDEIWVSLSTGRGFAPATLWYASTLYGTRDTIVADADGDGMADLIVVDTSKVIVALSTGSNFAAPTIWYNGTFHADYNLEVAPDPGVSFIALDPPSH